jgi:hypothetical protein
MVEGTSKFRKTYITLRGSNRTEIGQTTDKARVSIHKMQQTKDDVKGTPRDGNISGQSIQCSLMARQTGL